MAAAAEPGGTDNDQALVGFVLSQWPPQRSPAAPKGGIP
jgi:hypothetical protein